MSTKPVVNGAKPAAKPATKAVVAAKPAAKPEAAAKPKATFKASAKPVPKAPELKIKIGQDVMCRSTRTGVKTTGRFMGRTTLDKSPGEWLKVNLAPKGQPAEIKHYRSAQVTVA